MTKRSQSGKRTPTEIGVLFLLLTAALLAPATVQAACMEGKMSCSLNFVYNDVYDKILKYARIDYHPLVSPKATTQVECNEAGSGTTDLVCTSSVTSSTIYYIKGDSSKRIANPGWSSQGKGKLCEKICNNMGLTVYVTGGGPL